MDEDAIVTEVDLGPGHIVGLLDGVPALRERGTAALPSVRPMSIVATVAHLSYCAELLSILTHSEKYESQVIN